MHGRRVRLPAACAVALIVTAAVTACGPGEAVLSLDEAAHLSETAPPGGMTVHVDGNGLYRIDEAVAQVGIYDVATRLRRHYTGRAAGTTIRVVSYERATGYDLSLALHAARAAGVSELEGIAYLPSDDGRTRVERWRQSLEASAHPVGQDTAP